MFNNATVPMTQEVCYQCSIVFWMPTSFNAQCREQPGKKKFWCPSGHEQWYTGDSELDRERRLRQRAEQEKARLAQEAAEAERLRITAERALARHRKRAAAGTCPCCQRTFSNMTRHMKTKHPDFNVVPLRAAKA